MTAQYRVDYSPKSLSELAEIYIYIAQDSVQHATGMIERILDAADGLETFPHRNVVPDQTKKLPSPIRSLPVPPYVIFFRVFDDELAVRIMRIRHGARRRLKRY